MNKYTKDHFKLHKNPMKNMFGMNASQVVLKVRLNLSFN